MRLGDRAGGADRRRQARARPRAARRPRRRTRATGARGARRRPRTQFLIGWLGRMTEIKRVDELIRRLRARARTGIDGAARRSSATGRCAPALEALAAGAGRRRPLPLPRLSRAMSAPLYARARRRRAHLRERRDAGDADRGAGRRTPVVATDVGGVRDVVDDGETGLLVPAGDIDGDRRARSSGSHGDPRPARSDRARGRAGSRRRALLDPAAGRRTSIAFTASCSSGGAAAARAGSRSTRRSSPHFPRRCARSCHAPRAACGSSLCRSTSRPRSERPSRGCRRSPSTSRRAATR